MLLKRKHHRTLLFITLLTFVAQYMSVSVHASGMLDLNYQAPKSVLSYQQPLTDNHCQSMTKMGIEQKSLIDYSSKSCCGEDCSMMNCFMASVIVPAYNLPALLSGSYEQSVMVPIKWVNHRTSLYRPPIAA